MKNKIVEVGGMRWKIREAKTMDAALNAIAEARVSGSVGSKTIINKKYVGGGEEVIADVVRINSDDTELQPYTTPY